MMKVNVQHILTRTIQLLIFPVLMAACQLHEEPELTADGEWGVDPTEVNVDLNVRLTLSLPGQGEEEDAVGVLRVPSTNEYLRRFIVEAYLNRQPVARETFLEDITDRTHLTLPLNMKLHARNYQLLIWSDIVSAETPDEDLYYNTETLVPVIPNRSSHTGNTEYKDVFAASVPLDLTSYADQWGATVETDIELTRPVARYELIATDVEAFRQRIANGEVSGLGGVYLAAAGLGGDAVDGSALQGDLLAVHGDGVLVGSGDLALGSGLGGLHLGDGAVLYGNIVDIALGQLVLQGVVIRVGDLIALNRAVYAEQVGKAALFAGGDGAVVLHAQIDSLYSRRLQGLWCAVICRCRNHDQ